ncbi:MAG: DUF433 domain-containing protein [Gemmataceae bacterium]
MSEQREWKYLERNPRSSYKQLSFKGRKLHARTVYGQIVGEDGRTPEEAAEDYGLPLEAVLEAIEYCESNPPEIERDYMRERAIMEATGQNHPEYKWNPKKYYKPLSAEDRARINREFPE